MSPVSIHTQRSTLPPLQNGQGPSELLNGRFNYVLEFLSVKVQVPPLFSAFTHFCPQPATPQSQPKKCTLYVLRHLPASIPRKLPFLHPQCVPSTVHTLLSPVCTTPQVTIRSPWCHRALAALLVPVQGGWDRMPIGSSPSLPHLPWTVPRCSPTPF